MKVYSGKQREKGFTMLEVVLVVAILSIAMMITVPGLVRLSRDLKLKKLDDIAKEIYTSAQSRAVSLSVSGQLSRIGGVEAVSLAEDDSDAPSVAVVTRVSAPGGSVGDIDLLLPLGSIEEVVRQNYYLIEYNPVTAMIKGVYYWEKDNTFLADVYEAEGKDPTDRKDRMKYMVGYYGGGDIDRPSPSTGGDSAVTAELVNDEELYLKIEKGFSGSTPLNGVITVTLTDLDTKASKEIISFQNSNGEFLSGITRKDNHSISSNLECEGNSFKLTLDSLHSGLRFSELQETSDGDSFHPGCELKVTVTFKEEGKQPWSKEFRTNSLFASVSGDRNTTEGRTAYIACGRHLENLGLLWVYPDGKYPDGTKVKMSDGLNGVKRAVQTKDIDWHASLRKVGVNDLVSFKPIVNQNLEGFDGKGNKISNMDIFGDVEGYLLQGYPAGSGIGLFSRFEGNSLVGVNLVNCTIDKLDSIGTNPLNVGLLAGTVAPTGTCTISDCRAYAEKEKDDAGEESFITNNSCFINASGAASAGGLFGSVQATEAELKNCSASLTKLAGGTGAGQYTGGLAGQVGGTVTVTQCYADTGLWSSVMDTWASGLSGGTVGGLLGNAGGTLKLKESYAAGCIKESTAAAYGLVGSGSVSTMQNCYAAVAKGGGSAALAPKGIDTKDNFNYLEVAQSTPESPFVKATAGTTHAYGMPAPEGETFPVYPFPRLSGMPHYGDWPTAGRMSMAYYEVYQNGEGYSIGFYSSAREGNKVMTINTLKDSEDFTVVMDGYAVMLPTDAGDDWTVKYNGYKIIGNSTLKPKDALLDAKNRFGSMLVGGFDSTGNNITVKAMTYHPLFLSNAMMLEGENEYAAKNSYYQKLEFKADGFEVNVWFNPYVAKSEFVKVEDTAAGGPSAGFDPQKPLSDTILRTSRQVTAYSCNAMQTTAVGNGETPHTLRLERNIDCSKAFRTDSDYVGCVDLKISQNFVAEPNVILELNGKTLIGTGDSSAVSSAGGTLEIYGYTKKTPHLDNGTSRGTIQAKMKEDVPVIDGKGDVTLIGCTILDPDD